MLAKLVSSLYVGHEIPDDLGVTLDFQLLYMMQQTIVATFVFCVILPAPPAVTHNSPKVAMRPDNDVRNMHLAVRVPELDFAIFHVCVHHERLWFHSPTVSEGETHVVCTDYVVRLQGHDDPPYLYCVKVPSKLSHHRHICLRTPNCDPHAPRQFLQLPVLSRPILSFHIGQQVP